MVDRSAELLLADDERARAWDRHERHERHDFGYARDD
jgi:hypothetical protein